MILACNFLFGGVFVWFWYQGDGGLIECLWECSLLFSLLEELERDQCLKFFFVCLVEFACEAICKGVSFITYSFCFHHSKRWVRKDLPVLYVSKCFSYVFLYGVWSYI